MFPVLFKALGAKQWIKTDKTLQNLHSISVGRNLQENKKLCEIVVGAKEKNQAGKAGDGNLK